MYSVFVSPYYNLYYFLKNQQACRKLSKTTCISIHIHTLKYTNNDSYLDGLGLTMFLHDFSCRDLIYPFNLPKVKQMT